MNIYGYLAYTPHDFECMRLARNSCRLFLTNNQEEIGPVEQQAWGEECRAGWPSMFPVLFTGIDATTPPTPVGYGVVRRPESTDKAILTGGLLPQYRDIGLGPQLFSQLMLMVVECKTFQLDVLALNVRAYALYKKLGFSETARFEGPHGEVITLVRHV